LFSLRLEQDFEAAATAVSRGAIEPQSNNLLEHKWKELGQRRSVVYEEVLKKRLVS
jgi:hypothetical protein